METIIGTEPIVYADVSSVYTQGGSSKSYAQFTYTGSALGTTGSLASGTACSGTATDGSAMTGSLYSSVDLTTCAAGCDIKCKYATSDTQATYQMCQVGGLPSASQVTSGCLVSSSDITVNSVTLPAADCGTVENKAGRTLQGFATASTNTGKMFTTSSSCPGCPYESYQAFYDYYGEHGWADAWVLAAIGGTDKTFAATPSANYQKEADFATYSDDKTRGQCIKKGTAYMNVWMYVIREFEDAIDDCDTGALDNNDGSVHAWDEGVAFWTGSREGTDGSGSGKLIYALADKRCANFGTCGSSGGETTGTSKVNSDLLALFARGRNLLAVLDCGSVRPVVTEIVSLMTIPLIQGTLRYAYKMSTYGPYGSGTTAAGSAEMLTWNAEGATFAFAVLPLLSGCSSSAAQTVYNNMKLGAGPTCNKEAVKAAFEANYQCLGISCADVGALTEAGGCVADDAWCSVCYDSSNVAADTNVVYEKIAGYTPRSKVTDHNALDLDQAAMETELAKMTDAGFTNAKAIYQGGGNSKSYASITLSTALTSAISSGETVIGVNANGVAVYGSMKSSAAVGDSTISVTYDTNENQANYNGGCQVGSLQTTTTTGCFAVSDITVGYHILTPTAITNLAGRTLQGFATTSTTSSKMYTTSSSCPGCPYADFVKFYDYYGDLDYADKWALAALDATSLTYTSGKFPADFATNSAFKVRVDATKKGTAYMNVWMYVIREFEDAIDDCQTSTIDNNYDSAHAWDEGVAFYTGSLEGTDGSGSGKMIYALADKRCANFGTCGSSGGETSGTSKVNLDLFAEFALAQNYLWMAQCDQVRPVLNRIVPLMTIPLIQGTLRYAYKVGAYGPGGDNSYPTGSDDLLKSNAEGATFAAACLPMIHACSAAHAETIATNMAIGMYTPDYMAVKAAFEATYACLGITGAQVGALNVAGGLATADDAFGAVYVESPPPSSPAVETTVEVETTKKELSAGAIAGIAIAAAFAVIFGICMCGLIQKEKAGKPVFADLGGVKSPPV